MTAYFENHITNSQKFRTELKRIMDKNFDFQTLIGAFDEDKAQDKISLYRKLTQEEVKEFNEALDNNDLNEAVKELADIFVVASVYARLQLGYSYENHVRDVYNVNGIYKLSIGENNWEGMSEVNTIEEILTTTIMMARSWNFDFLPYLEAVVDNNFDKLPLKGSIEDPEKDAKTIEEASEGRYTGVGFELITDAEGNERYKFTDGNGKLMKPVGYKTVTFEIE